ncbi:MAG: hypothetical protein ACOYM8_03875 [Caulobacterales bacterium]
MPVRLRAARGARPLDRRLQLIGALVAAASLIAAAPPPMAPLILQEQVWLAPGADPARSLTHAPVECLAASTPQIEAGRALFRAPTILGGPAARAGLSCAACHAQGRVNNRFFLPELTDRAGAADVTSEWASAVRGDGVMNPIPIPDLAGAGSRSAYGATREPDLARFIRGVVVDEFQGRDDPARLAALTAYVAALRAPCPADERAIAVKDALDDVRRAVAAAAAVEDPALAGSTLLAAQHLIGLIVERLPAAEFPRERSALAALAGDLGALRALDGRAATIASEAPGWRARFDAVASRVERRAGATYFDARRLRHSFESQRNGLAGR